MAEDYKLLKTQKNEVFKILQEAGLEPANFSWAEEPSISNSEVYVSRLNYGGSQFYFQFDFFRNLQWRNSSDPKLTTSHYCEFSPGEDAVVSREHPGSWRLQKDNVHYWAKYIKRQIEAPDLWSEIEKYRAALPLVTNEQLVNEPIPAYEVDEIVEKIQLLADKIEKQFELDEEQNQFVRSKLNYLEDAAKRQPRRDWENILISVFIGIAFQLALEPTKAQQFWQLVKGIIGPFIHLLGS